MERNNDTRTRTVFSVIFAFFICIMLSGFILCSVVSATFMNPAYLNRTLEKSKYIDRNYGDLTAALEKEAESRELPVDILTGLLDEKQFKSDLEKNIASASNGDPTVNDEHIEAWKSAVKDEVASYLKKNDIGNNRWVRTTVEEISDISGSYYMSYSAFPSGVIFNDYRNDALATFLILIPGFLVICLILIFILFRIQTSQFKGWYYLFSSIWGASLVSIIIGGILYIKTNYSFDGMLAGYSVFINQFFCDVSAIFIMCGIGLIILSIIGLMILRRKEEKLIQSENE